jgi:hypothetical protein
VAEIVVFAQADSIDVRLELRPSGDAAELERLVLRAIAAGVNDWGTLGATFGLTPRFVVDLLRDLWTRGRISIDLGASPEVIELSPDGQKYLSDQDAQDGARVTISKSRVLLERLTGRVVGEIAAGRGDRSLTVPLLPNDREVRQVRAAELEEAVRQNFERREADYGFLQGQRITSVRAATSTEQSSRRQLVPIRLVATRDGEAVSISVTDPDLTIEQRQVAARRIEAFVRENPRTSFATALRGQAEQHAGPGRSRADFIAELKRNTRELESADPGNRQSMHDRLAALANNLLDDAASMADREMDLRIVADGADHEDAIRSVIDSARVQLVIAAQSVRGQRLEVYRESLNRAVERGVRIFLLWGLTQQDSTLNDDVRQDLYAIARRGKGGGGLRFSATSAHIHAKVIIADDRSALVTSKNFLSTSDLAELGAVVTADEGRPSPVIEELLSWAARTMPDYGIGNQILRASDEFGDRSASSSFIAPALPRFDAGVADAPVGAPIAALWARSWRQAADAVIATTKRHRPVVRPLIDGLHHTLVRELLNEVSDRMIVASHRISAPVVARDLTSRAEGAARRGVIVEMLYGELDTSMTEADVAGLAPELGIRVRESNHSKVLVADDTVVIGSFNYLSFIGVSRRGMSSEISLQIESAAIADEVATALGTRRAGLPGGTASNAASRATDDTLDMGATLELARSLVARLNDPAGITVEQVSAEAPIELRPKVIQAIADAGLHDDAGRLISAFLLSGHRNGRVDWARALFDQRVANRDWIGAAAFRPILVAAAALPSVELVDAMAASDDDLVLYAEDLKLEADATPFALYLASRLLIDSRVELTKPLDERAADLPAAPAELIRTVLRHANDFGGLDRQAVQASRLRVASETDRETAWNDLDLAIRRLRDVDTRVLAGHRTISFAFSEGEEYDVVTHLASTRDTTGVAEWLRDHESNDVRWVDETARRAAAEQILAGLRDRFATRRGAVRSAAAKVVRSEGAVPPDARPMLGGEQQSLERIVALATSIQIESGSMLGDVLGRMALSRLAQVLEPMDDAALSEAWRYPRLTARSHTDADAAVDAAASDLFDIRTPASAIEVLLREDDLEGAEILLRHVQERDLLDDRVRERLDREIELARERRDEDRRANIFDVVVRAQSLGVVAQRADRWANATALGGDAVEADLAADIAELDRVEAELRERILTGAAELPESAEAVREHVAELIDRQEWSAATAALDARAHYPEDPVPAPFPWTGWTLREISRALDGSVRYPGFDKFLPVTGDVRGERVALAIRGLAISNDDPAALQEYVAAIQDLVEPDAPVPVLKLGPDGWSADFVVPQAQHFRWRYESEQVGVGEWAPAGVAFRLGLDTTGRPRSGLVTIPRVMELLHAPDPETRVGLRRNGFLRAVHSGLPVEQVLGDARHDDRPVSVSVLGRVLYLLDIDVDRIERGSLQAMLGDHPFLLWQIVQWIRDTKSPPYSFTQLRGSREFDERVVEALVEDLVSSSTIVTLATLAEWAEPDGMTSGELLEMIRAEAHDRSADPLPDGIQLVDVDAELRTLVRLRYSEEISPGRFRMRRETVWYALRRQYRSDRLTKAFGTAVVTARSTRRADISDQRFRTLLHIWRGRIVEGDKVDERKLRLDLDALLDPRLAISAADMLLAVRWEVSVRPDVHFESRNNTVQSTRMFGPYFDLAITLSNAIQNSLQALDRDHVPDPFIVLTAAETDETVTFTVRDNGRGFDATTLSDFAADRDVPSSHSVGSGGGLGHYREFNAHRRGEIRLSNADTGGAVVTVIMKRVSDTAGSTPSIPDGEVAV